MSNDDGTSQDVLDLDDTTTIADGEEEAPHDFIQNDSDEGWPYGDE